MPPTGFQQTFIVNGINNTAISCVNCKMIGAFLEDHKSEEYF